MYKDVMMKIYKDILQGTDEWFDVRRGLMTASEMKLLMSPTKFEIADNDKSRSHLYELVAQRVTGYTEPSFINDDMLRGNEGEIYARAIYAEKYAPVEEIGFVTAEISDGVTIGYSPDGFVGDDGLIEIKTRKQKFQIETILSNEVPREYILQIQTGLLVTGRPWCDYIQYCGGLPLFVKRVFSDMDLQSKICLCAIQTEAVMKQMQDNFYKNSKDLFKTERIIEQEIEV